MAGRRRAGLSGRTAVWPGVGCQVKGRGSGRSQVAAAAPLTRAVAQPTQGRPDRARAACAASEVTTTPQTSARNRSSQAASGRPTTSQPAAHPARPTAMYGHGAYFPGSGTARTRCVRIRTMSATIAAVAITGPPSSEPACLLQGRDTQQGRDRLAMRRRQLAALGVGLDQLRGLGEDGVCLGAHLQDLDPVVLHPRGGLCRVDALGSGDRLCPEPGDRLRQTGDGALRLGVPGTGPTGRDGDVGRGQEHGGGDQHGYARGMPGGSHVRTFMVSAHDPPMSFPPPAGQAANDL
ncbi:Transcriptional regulator, AraC family [Streptomyces lividans 1326]|uniref:Transcriptional regulator, AraC family n=1 Tax=Streptomyces lividans 1326 TaxID=1200984 RepID=A0A7U9HFY0_STRLI|nr:Transcriptional regulator, AraC family [Streptomyces lividans 1326]